ncbi:MAG: hypothetical protein P8Y45_24275 [Exilibacterium sp.]
MKNNYDKKRMDGKKITIGLLLDTDELPAWLYESIHKITALDYVDIAVLIYNDSEGTQLHEAEGNQHQSGKRFNPFFCKKIFAPNCRRYLASTCAREKWSEPSRC